jgi:hypothetical protein
MIAAMPTAIRNFDLNLCNEAPNSTQVVPGISLSTKEAHWIISHTNLASE